MTVNLDDDPRWQRLHDREWTCPCCGESHGGLFDLAVPKPSVWQGDEKPRPNTELDTSTSILTDDFCVLDGEHFFVRGALMVPIIGNSDEYFGFGAWSSL